jgi:hypothetical protein
MSYLELNPKQFVVINGKVQQIELFVRAASY